jgi:hypothetical protein
MRTFTRTGGDTMRGRFLVTLMAVVLGVSACATYPVASTVVSDPGRQVSAEASRFSFLWLQPLPLSTASELLQELVDQCDGPVTGVTTAVKVGFALVGQTEEMRISGYCVE